MPFAKPYLMPIPRLMEMMPLLLPPMTLATAVMEPPELPIYFLAAPLPGIKISHGPSPCFYLCLLPSLSYHEKPRRH